MIEYRTTPDGVAPDHLAAFFEGWHAVPDDETRLEVLAGSAHVVVAWDGDRVVGFVTAISDGVLAAFIPLLEVVPEYRGRGIGTELVRRMLSQLSDLYSVDLVCDDDLVPFYEGFGMHRWTAMIRRNPKAFG